MLKFFFLWWRGQGVVIHIVKEVQASSGVLVCEVCYPEKVRCFRNIGVWGLLSKQGLDVTGKPVLPPLRSPVA